jgi:cation:H+ antiporter
MSSLLGVLLLLAGLLIVVAGADVFLDGLLATARRYRVAPFAMAVVVSGFEVENIVAGIAANLQGLPGAAAGTVLGGITFLALGVSGFGALIAPIKAPLPGRALLWTAAAPLPLLILTPDGLLSRLDGALLIVWFLFAIMGLARSGTTIMPDDGDEASLRRPAVRLLAGIALLGVGGEMLGEGLRTTVSRLGISSTLLGNTAVAAAVEGEEIIRVAAPARRGRGDVALGNILGTIVHFAAFNAGVIALVKPLTLDTATLRLHLPVAVAATLLLCALIQWHGKLDRRAGMFLLIAYAAYVTTAIILAR